MIMLASNTGLRTGAASVRKAKLRSQNMTLCFAALPTLIGPLAAAIVCPEKKIVDWHSPAPADRSVGSSFATWECDL